MRLTVVLPTKLSSNAPTAKKKMPAVGRVLIEYNIENSENVFVFGVLFYALKKTAKLRMSI